MTKPAAPLAEIETPRFQYHTDRTSPSNGEIFVFGSNLAGRHGKGAALYAKRYKGAKRIVFQGFVGQCYAIPTKDAKLVPLSLEAIAQAVQVFIEFAKSRPDMRFFVTRIGCGLAGFRDDQIAPMFAGAPPNCSFARQWRFYLEPSECP